MDTSLAALMLLVNSFSLSSVLCLFFCWEAQAQKPELWTASHPATVPLSPQETLTPQVQLFHLLPMGCPLKRSQGHMSDSPQNSLVLSQIGCIELAYKLWQLTKYPAEAKHSFSFLQTSMFTIWLLEALLLGKDEEKTWVFFPTGITHSSLGTVPSELYARWGLGESQLKCSEFPGWALSQPRSGTENQEDGDLN